VSRGARGRVWVHSVAFLLLLVSAFFQARAALHSELRPAWTSIGLSGLAIVVAVANLAVPARRGPPPNPTGSE
jgi:hypothetical protein